MLSDADEVKAAVFTASPLALRRLPLQRRRGENGGQSRLIRCSAADPHEGCGRNKEPDFAFYQPLCRT